MFVALLVALPAGAAGNVSPSFTDAQAWRGRLAYIQECAECHGGNLGGSIGPALAGPDGNLQWQSGKAVYAYFSVHMPHGNPGALPTAEYVDIMAFLYQQHHHAAGRTPLNLRAIAGDAALLGT